MKKKSGIIYDLGNNRYGLAIHSEQHASFLKMKKVFVHVFKDRFCQEAELDEMCKEVSTLKNISNIKAIGFSD